MDAAMNNITAKKTPVFARMRTDAYVLLSALLGAPPTEGLHEIISDLRWDEAIPHQLEQTLNALRNADREYSVEAMKMEFDKLFIGLGGGELIPYASWYLEKRVQARPLAVLRTNLYRLGIVKQAQGLESEDHAASVCEAMAIISNERHGCSLEEQAYFFRGHLANWMPDFFEDLRKAGSAKFYRRVGAFGSSFMEYEDQHLGRHPRSTPRREKEAK